MLHDPVREPDVMVAEVMGQPSGPEVDTVGQFHAAIPDAAETTL
jgi:hypothetical protein